MTGAELTGAELTGAELTGAESTDQPVLSVVAGDPTPVELAALVAVLAGRAGRPHPATNGQHRSEWSSPARMLSVPPIPGSGGWRASGLPG